MFSDQGNKAAGEEGAGAEFALLVEGHELEVLKLARADRNEEASSRGQLCDEGEGEGGCPGGHEDGIPGRPFGHTKGSIPDFEANVLDSEGVEPLPGFLGEHRVPLDRADLPCQKGKHGGLVATPRPDFEDPVFVAEGKGLGHSRDHVGLRECLASPDRNRGVGPGARVGPSSALREEALTGDRTHRVEDPIVAHAASLDLLSHHLFPSKSIEVGGVPIGCGAHEIPGSW